MGILILLFTGLLAVAALLASIAIWSPRALVIRSIAVLVTAAFIPLAYLALNELLSKPKPIARAWLEPAEREATLLSYSFDEGKAIYLWLRLDDSPEPRAYLLPWDIRFAERLQNLSEQAGENDGVVRLRNPFAHRNLQDPVQMNMRIVVPRAPRNKPLPPPAQVYDPREQRI